MATKKTAKQKREAIKRHAKRAAKLAVKAKAERKAKMLRTTNALEARIFARSFGLGAGEKLEFAVGVKSKVVEVLFINGLTIYDDAGLTPVDQAELEMHMANYLGATKIKHVASI